MREEPQIEIPDPSQQESGRFSFALILAAAALLIIVAAVYFLPGRQSPPGGAPQSQHLAFGPAEQEYALRLQIDNIALSRAENFLHQEVTTLSAEIVNGGQQSIRGIEVTIEFFDEMNQIALRESHSILAPGSAALAPAERRAFEVSFEHISASWNRQQPLVHVTGLQF
jgi:hypothetical protein